MYTFILTIHIIVTISLIGIILVQRGRSSGLIEALGGVESIFGSKTNTFFVKTTVFLAITFFVTSISLAFLSKTRSTSLIERELKREEKVKTQPSKETNNNTPVNKQDSSQTSKVNEEGNQ